MQKIRSELMEKHRKLMPRIWEEQENLAELYATEKRDPEAIGEAYDRLAKLQREALQARIEAENQSANVLSKEQRAQLRRGCGWGMMGY